jgi:hypothetical protein
MLAGSPPHLARVSGDEPRRTGEAEIALSRTSRGSHLCANIKNLVFVTRLSIGIYDIPEIIFYFSANPWLT